MIEAIQIIFQQLKDIPKEWGRSNKALIVYRLLVAPITLPLILGGLFCIGLSQLITTGKFDTLL